MSEPIHIISLGAGVQSSTMALMAAKGEITPMPNFAVFADTGDEKTETISYLEYLQRILPYPVYRAHKSVLSEHLFEWGQSQIPAFYVKQDGKVAIGKRQCTNHWKIIPVLRKIREITETSRKRLPPGWCSLWKGISVDEISRAKDDRSPWITARFPLIEKNLNRNQCLAWLENNHFLVPPKSACVFCPFQGPRQWAEHKRNEYSWRKICRVSDALAARSEYLTPDCKPIQECDFSTEEERGQLNMFNNECEGMCGV